MWMIKNVFFMEYGVCESCFENDASMYENDIVFDLEEVDYITSDGLSSLLRLTDKGKNIKLINYNEHIKESLELVKLHTIM